MRSLNFTKMHGAGNDFVVLNCLNNYPKNIEKLAESMCRRRFGVGADQMILICPGEKAALRMEIFNADGSQVEMCGNALRTVALYASERLDMGNEVEIETLGGLAIAQVCSEGVRVDMGAPSIAAQDLGLNRDEPVVGLPLTFGNFSGEATCVSMGNPHVVFFVDDVDQFPLETRGPRIEVDPLFKNRTNVEFVEVIDRKHLKMRVWERGSGETLACGSGACASAVAAILNELCEDEVVLQLRGGDLVISWDRERDAVMMTGPAEFVFDGVWQVED